MYVRLWGVTFMSDCEVTLRPSGASLVWALNVRLVFLFVSVQGSLAWLSIFLALVFGVGSAAPDLGRPLKLVPGCNELLSIMFLTQCPRLGTSWLPPVASQCYQTLVPSFAPVRLLCGGFPTRFPYDLGLKCYHHIKYNYLK